MMVMGRSGSECDTAISKAGAGADTRLQRPGHWRRGACFEKDLTRPNSRRHRNMVGIRMLRSAGSHGNQIVHRGNSPNQGNGWNAHT